MSVLSRTWETMTARERIVAMSLVTGGVVAIVNSTVWAVATCFIVSQKAHVRIAEAHEQAYLRLGRAATMSHNETGAGATIDQTDAVTLDDL